MANNLLHRFCPPKARPCINNTLQSAKWPLKRLVLGFLPLLLKGLGTTTVTELIKCVKSILILAHIIFISSGKIKYKSVNKNSLSKKFSTLISKLPLLTNLLTNVYI